VFFLDYPPVYGWLASPYFDWRLSRAELPFLATAVAATPLETLYTCDNWDTCLWSPADPAARYPAAAPVSVHLVSNRGLWQPTTHRDTVARWTALVGGQPACLHQAFAKPTPALLQQPEVRAMQARFAAERAAGRRIVGMHHRTGDAVMAREAAGDDPVALAAAADIIAANAAANAEIYPEVAAAIAAAAAAAAAAGPAAPMSPYDKARAMMRAVDSSNAAFDTLQDYAAGAHAAGSTVFFASDSVELRSAVRDAFPGVLTTNTKPMHVGNDLSDWAVGIAHEAARSGAARSETDGMREALVDWWLLANADIRVGATTSGFMRTATVHSLSGEWLVGFECLDIPRCCGEGVERGTHHRVIAECFVSQSGV
jgi:hypothetical protein